MNSECESSGKDQNLRVVTHSTPSVDFLSMYSRYITSMDPWQKEELNSEDFSWLSFKHNLTLRFLGPHQKQIYIFYN
jgi:hypothetical protein